MVTQGLFRVAIRMGLFAALALSVACSGSVGNGSSTLPEEDDAGPLEPPPNGPGSACKKAGPSPLRRLSRSEYLATLRDLFPGVDLSGVDLTPDSAVHGFENRADKLFANENNVSEFSRGATEIASKAAAKMESLVSCASAADEACGKTFVRDFGQRAFRRPLTETELGRYSANFEDIRKELGFAEAAQLTIEAMLQSVNFLYRMDIGQEGSESEGRMKLSSWEMASRLSYLLWGSMPDAELFAAAKKDELQSDAEILAHARRMLKDERVKPQLVDFHRQWLDYEHINVVYKREGDKDQTKFAAYDETLRNAMREESDRFTEMVMSEGSHTLAELLTSRQTYVNAPLAKFYGVAAAPSGWDKVELPENERAGILTRGSFLASHGHKFSGSPPLRAVYVMRRLLCFPEMIPSPDADTSEPVQQQGEAPKTNRQLFEARVAASSKCTSCHRVIDPIGFTFEHYDAIGKYRDKDNGLDVDASGALYGTDVDGPVANAMELSQKLAESRDVQMCMARQWLGFATGVEPEEEDCRVDRLTEVLKAAKGDVHTMLLSLVKSPDFLTRSAP